MTTPKSPKPLDLEQSVAGEEDPGAAVDETLTPGKASNAKPPAPAPHAKPQDDALGDD